MSRKPLTMAPEEFEGLKLFKSGRETLEIWRQLWGTAKQRVEGLQRILRAVQAENTQLRRALLDIGREGGPRHWSRKHIDEALGPQDWNAVDYRRTPPETRP